MLLAAHLCSLVLTLNMVYFFDALLPPGCPKLAWATRVLLPRPDIPTVRTEPFLREPLTIPEFPRPEFVRFCVLDTVITAGF